MSTNTIGWDRQSTVSPGFGPSPSLCGCLPSAVVFAFVCCVVSALVLVFASRSGYYLHHNVRRFGLRPRHSLSPTRFHVFLFLSSALLEFEFPWTLGSQQFVLSVDFKNSVVGVVTTDRSRRPECRPRQIRSNLVLLNTALFHNVRRLLGGSHLQLTISGHALSSRVSGSHKWNSNNRY